MKNRDILGIETVFLTNKGNRNNNDKKARYSEMKLDQGGQQDGLRIDRIKNIMPRIKLNLSSISDQTIIEKGQQSYPFLTKQNS